MQRWVERADASYGFSEETRVEPIRGAALPMAFNRKPHYADGLLLVGDSAGMVNPFNGEGIAYAMESGALAADVIAQALRRPTAYSREKALADYPRAAQAGVRRLLHDGPRLREAHREPRDHAALHAAGLSRPDADEVDA